jgi:hypothetical protein
MPYRLEDYTIFVIFVNFILKKYVILINFFSNIIIAL